MVEFLETIANLKAKEADIQTLFGGDGASVRQNRHQKTERYQRQLVEAGKLVKDVYTGRLPYHYFQEAMGTDDFPLLFGDILDRQLLGSYREFPSEYRSYVRIRQVRDFRTVSRFAVDGAEQILTTVAEHAEYPEENVDESRDQYSVAKRGRRIPISWESMINDDLDALKDMPERLGKAARRSEAKFATELFATTAGPSTAIFTTANGNLLATSGTGLSVATLQDAFTLLGNQTDADGEPIFVDAVHLVVPPALEVTAQNILNAISIDLTTAGGGGGQTVRAANWMRNRTQLHVDPYLPIVITGARGDTEWFLFGDPGSGRPTLEMGFLRGHLEPEIRIKSPNSMRVGGGAVSAMDGDFDTDSIQYRVRHVFGGAALTGTGGYRSAVGVNVTT